MRSRVILSALIGLLIAGVGRAELTVANVTHQDLQAVDAAGSGTYGATDKVVVTGIILNNPEDMLDSTPGPNAAWQIYIQGEGDDHAGTAVYMREYGATYGGTNYSDAEWLAELHRVNYDPNTGYLFAAGDEVRVTGRYKFNRGKLNINERHWGDPDWDFQVELIKPAVGLPQPELITLDMVRDKSGQFLFDQTRLTGCEYYQARLVRVDDVNIVNPDKWVPDGEEMKIRDNTGREFPVKLGLGDGFTRYPCPVGQIDVIAIFDQESSNGRTGYRLWVMDYDGNGLVLTDRGGRKAGLPWDVTVESQADPVQ
jgi:hypothetical protein